MADFSEQTSIHVPVMLQEAMDALKPCQGGVYIDGTLGGGGHTEALCRAVGPTGLVIAFDRDVSAIDRTEKRLRSVFEKEFGLGEFAQKTSEEEKNHANQNFQLNKFPIRFVHANYRHLDEALDLLKIETVDGILLDLGLSSDQMADRERGFSFDSDGLLDLRFDTSEGEPAYERLAWWSEEDIANTIYQLGEERFSRRIAKRIVEQRVEGHPVQTARELAEIIRSCVPRIGQRDRNKTRERGKRLVAIDPATRTFQALRIAVNDELGSLESTLKIAPSRLKPGGVMAVISFHSLEDRIVKNAFRDDTRWTPTTKKPVVASDEEVRQNPRARSAKLRAAKFRIPYHD